MTDRPIIFSAPMIRALLEGRKTQTRRLLKPQPENHMRFDLVYDGKAIFRNVAHGLRQDVSVPYRPGDRLWVREAHALVGSVDPPWVLYRASGYASECVRHGFDLPWPPEPRWRPSIHMPRWASRLTLVVTDVRVQRVQEISEADAVAEGWPARCDFRRPLEHFYGPDAWDQNPWVCAISFDVHRCNIDQMEVTG